MKNDPGHCNILFCRSAVAYRDVGEGRKQDAEASPARIAARRRSYRSVSDLSKCELDLQSYPVNQKLSKQILLLIVRGKAVTGAANSLNKAVMPGRFE
jgi:hypothetical protein